MLKVQKNTGKGIAITGKVDVQAYLAAHGYPELTQFGSQEALQRFYKDLTQEQIDEWVKLEGVTYVACPGQPAIHRMRATMALLHQAYPPVRKGKPESAYKQYTLEQLVELAIERDVPVEVTADERIMRMRTIMALKEHKVMNTDGTVNPVAAAK